LKGYEFSTGAKAPFARVFSSSHRAFVIIEEEDLGRLKGSLSKVSYEVVESVRAGHRKLFLITNRAVQ